MSVTKISKAGLITLLSLLVVMASYLVYPDWLISLLAWQSPQVVYFVDTPEPVVALTIDDGPDPVTTPQILDLLKQYKASATFFLISNRIPGNEAIVRHLLAEGVAGGHEIGNHLTQDALSINLPPAEFERQLLEADGVLSDFAEMRWFRPGSGWYNAKMLEIVDKHNYRPALGSVYPFDPHIPSSWFAAQYILWNVEPGAVIILHDYGSKGKNTVKTLARVLPELERRGYRVVTLSELVELEEK